MVANLVDYIYARVVAVCSVFCLLSSKVLTWLFLSSATSSVQPGLDAGPDHPVYEIAAAPGPGDERQPCPSGGGVPRRAASARSSGCGGRRADDMPAAPVVLAAAPTIVPFRAMIQLPHYPAAAVPVLIPAAAAPPLIQRPQRRRRRLR